MIKNIFATSCFVSVLFLSLGLKISSTHHNPINNQKSDIKKIAERMLNYEWTKYSRINLLNNDHLIATSYFNDFCPDKPLYTVALYRNSENVPVVEERLVKNENNLTFIYNERTYTEFPSLTFWFGQNFQRLHTLFGSKNLNSHYVLGIVTNNDSCGDITTELAKR